MFLCPLLLGCLVVFSSFLPPSPSFFAFLPPTPVFPDGPKKLEKRRERKWVAAPQRKKSAEAEKKRRNVLISAEVEEESPRIPRNTTLFFSRIRVFFKIHFFYASLCSFWILRCPVFQGFPGGAGSKGVFYFLRVARNGPFCSSSCSSFFPRYISFALRPPILLLLAITRMVIRRQTAVLYSLLIFPKRREVPRFQLFLLKVQNCTI